MHFVFCSQFCPPDGTSAGLITWWSEAMKSTATPDPCPIIACIHTAYIIPHHWSNIPLFINIYQCTQHRPWNKSLTQPLHWPNESPKHTRAKWLPFECFIDKRFHWGIYLHLKLAIIHAFSSTSRINHLLKHNAISTLDYSRLQPQGLTHILYRERGRESVRYIHRYTLKFRVN